MLPAEEDGEEDRPAIEVALDERTAAEARAALPDAAHAGEARVLAGMQEDERPRTIDRSSPGRLEVGLPRSERLARAAGSTSEPWTARRRAASPCTSVPGRSSTGHSSGLRSTTHRSAWWPGSSEPMPSQRRTWAASRVHIASASSRVDARGRRARAAAGVGRLDRERDVLEDVLRPPVGAAADVQAGVEQPAQRDQVLEHLLADPLADELALAPGERHARGHVEPERGGAARVLGLEEVEVLEQPGAAVGRRAGRPPASASRKSRYASCSAVPAVTMLSRRPRSCAKRIAASARSSAHERHPGRLLAERAAVGIAHAAGSPGRTGRRAPIVTPSTRSMSSVRWTIAAACSRRAAELVVVGHRVPRHARTAGPPGSRAPAA